MLQTLFKFFLSILEFILWSLVILTGLVSLAGFWGDGIQGRFSWQLDLLSHFRFQYFIIELVCCFGLLFLFFVRKRAFFPSGLSFFLPLLFLGIDGSQVLPYYFPATPHPTSEIATHFRILHINVLGTNRNSPPIIQLIQNTQADIISFQEYNQWWEKELESSGALKEYPYHFKPKWDDDGIYSKFPLQNLRVDYLPETGYKDATILADIDLAGKPVTLIVSHPPTPIRPDLYSRQVKHFKRWKDLQKSLNERLIVLGDLNASPWSLPFRNFINATGLSDTEQGFGIQRSYPSFNPQKAVPIDHCLISRHFVTLSRTLGPNVGSDHLPLILELGLLKNP